MKKYTYFLTIVARMKGALGTSQKHEVELQSDTKPDTVADPREVENFLSLYDQYEHIHTIKIIRHKRNY